MNQRLAPFCRVTVYESANRFYLVGSDLGDKRFCLLKIDRTEGRELVFSNGDHEYTKKELNEVLAMIHGSSAASSKASATYVLNERIERAKGLLGFVRFLEGYYMVVITKSTKVAQLGYHHIYKIDETDMIYIPSKSDTQQNNAEEQRYMKLFQSVDLATDFYFSYTYDLTRTLQDNIARPNGGIYEKYVWNSYLLEPLLVNGVNSRWVLPVVHGFLGSCSLAIKGFTFNLLLLARRSNKFAGTRFLKRGANTRGYVANEVETEQIVYDSSISPFQRGRFTSFVQLRGSVPLVWSQDLTKVVGKPPIQLHSVDPFAVIPALHFQELRSRYDDPIIVINLVKRRERRRHESLLNDEFRTSISYLNQFLNPKQAILYLSFDMARCHKTGNVLPKLEEIGYNVVKLNGWFQTFPPWHYHQLRPAIDDVVQQERAGRFFLQTGVPRVNCVDCLDRTNVAQFVIGKVALSYQLYALGLLDEPRLNLETEICRILETLYEEHGDTLALQYAGSQLVHSIRTYKKISIFQERSRDVIQTLSRYYSNTFSDYDKQNAINLFLGVFRPSQFKAHLWELSTDWVLHNPFNGSSLSGVDYCAWFEVPIDYWQSRVIQCHAKVRPDSVDSGDEGEGSTHLRDYDRYYRTFELTSFDSLVFKHQRALLQIDSATSPPTLSAQPFMKLWKKQEGNGGRITGRKTQDGKRSSRRQRQARDGCVENEQDESSSEEDAAAHSDAEIQYSTPWYGVCPPATPSRWETRLDACMDAGHSVIKLQSITDSPYLQSMRAVYGTDIQPPNKLDMLKYERYAELGGAYCNENADEAGQNVQTNPTHRQRRVRRFVLPEADGDPHPLLGLLERPSGRYDALQPLSMFTGDNCFGVAPPLVSEATRRIYEQTVLCCSEGPRTPAPVDCQMYAKYAKNYNALLRGLNKMN